MKIVFLSYTFWPPYFGGELLMAEERLKEMAARGHQVLVLTAGAEGYPSLETVDGMQVYRSPFVGKNKVSRILRYIFFWFWSLGKLFSIPEIDVVHFNSLPGFETITSNLYGGVAAWIAHCKKARTVTVHSLASEEENYFTQNFWQRIFFHFVDYLVCVGDGLFDAAKTVYPEKSIKILYGVHDDLFTPLSHDSRKEFRRFNGISETDVVFAFLGSIVRRKGFDLVAEVFSEVYPQHNNWRLWVIGPRNRAENQNINEQEVSQVTAPLIGMNEVVKYWGRIDDRGSLAQILGASDVFVFPTRREGMPISPLEAMSTGLPLIISKLPGVTDLANIEGQTGLYVTPGNKEELRSAMVKLAEDKSLRETMGRAARRRIVDHFSWQQHVDRWEQLYLGEFKE